MYWLGRYLERAEAISRLLRLQVETLIDRPVWEIRFGWDRVYRYLERTPPVGGIVHWDQDEYELADSFTLANDLTFERHNPGSVWSCFKMGRENARQIRHCLTGEMWICLNVAYLRTKEVTIEDVWVTSPASFYAELNRDIATFMGVAQSTMYREEAWSLLQLGRAIENVQHSIALLRAQLSALERVKEESDVHWISLLRFFHAEDVYEANHGIEMERHAVLSLLATDSFLPRSVCRALDEVHDQLMILGEISGRKAVVAANAASQISSLFRYDWPGGTAGDHELQKARTLAHRLHHELTRTYFNYDLTTV